jgi:hypothetical protein
MSDPEWNLTESMLAGLEFVEWLSIGSGDWRNFIDVYEKDNDLAWCCAEDQGWVETIVPASGRPWRLGEGTREPEPKLTGVGHRQLEEVRRLRSNRADRAAACRQAIILWLYNDGRGAAGTDEFIPAEAYRFYGTPFTEDEVDEAITYLLDRDLIQGMNAFGQGLSQPELTTDGIECVEHHNGDIRGFMAPQQSGLVTFSQTFNAPVSGQVAQGQTVQQTQHQSIDSAALTEILQTMRDALSDVRDPDDRDDAEHAIRELEVAVDEGDQAEVQKRAGRLQRLANRLGSTALTTATTAGTNELLQSLGLG